MNQTSAKTEEGAMNDGFDAKILNTNQEVYLKLFN